MFFGIGSYRLHGQIYTFVRLAITFLPLTLIGWIQHISV